MKLKEGITFEKAQRIIDEAEIKLGRRTHLQFEENDRLNEYEVTPWAVFKVYLPARGDGWGEKKGEKVSKIFNTIFPVSYSDFDNAMEKTGGLNIIKTGSREYKEKYRNKLRGKEISYDTWKLSQDTLNKTLDFLHLEKDTTPIQHFINMVTPPTWDTGEGGPNASRPEEGTKENKHSEKAGEPLDESNGKNEEEKENAELNELNENLEKLGLEGKERTAIVKQRINQGIFRKRTLARCRGKCVVTGVEETEKGKDSILIASHIIAWQDCPEKRLDGENGLLLAPHIDKFFDRHLISFDNDGKLVYDNKKDKELTKSIKKALDMWHVDCEKVLDPSIFTEKTKANMEIHREIWKNGKA